MIFDQLHKEKVSWFQQNWQLFFLKNNIITVVRIKCFQKQYIFKNTAKQKEAGNNPLKTFLSSVQSLSNSTIQHVS